jgi:hypothetical protein
MARARRETGLERFGDESFRPALRRLIESLRGEANLNPFGRHMAPLPLLRALKNRLWANACFEAHPEILRRRIAAPLVIVGPVRSGTTRLQRLLAADPRFQSLSAWEGFSPAPRRPLPDADRIARRREASKLLRARRRFYPGADTTHPMDTDWPEEEILLLNQSFCGLSPLGFYHVPSYGRWLLDHDRAHAYRYMANLIRLIAWSRGSPEDTPWVLKTPQHLLDLDLLVRVLPEAKLVFIHRDPVKTVASTLSLAWHLAVQNTDLPCRGTTRDTWFDLCETMARRAMATRDSLGGVPQLDVYFEEMNRDWRAAMRRIYEFAGLEFSPEAEDAQASWLAGSERENRHGGHRYSLADFGLTRQDVDARMMFVRERYGIAYEAN